MENCAENSDEPNEISRLESKLIELQKTDAALRAREKRWTTVIETIPHGIEDITVDGTITFSNRAHHRILGYQEGELIGKSITELVVDPDEKEFLPEHLKDLARNQPPPEPYFTKNFTKDGRIIDIRVDWNYQRDDNGRVMGFTSVITDITDKLAGNRALMESELRYRAIFEGSREGILLADIDTYQFRVVNPAICKFLGYRPEELKQMSVPDIHPEPDRKWILENFQRQASDDRFLAEQIPCLRKDGRIVYADIRSASIEIKGRRYLVGFFADVTDHLKVKNELNEQVAFLQTLVDTLPHPIFYKDTQGRYLGCNKSFETYIGMPREELIGKTVYDIAPKELADIYFEADNSLFSSPNHQIYEADVRYADGTLRSVIFNKAIFFRKDGSPGGLVGAMVDITKRKKAEAERLLLAKAIEQSPELVIITDLEGRIHYVNAAFERISGYLRSEVIGLTPAILKSGEHDEQHYKTLWQNLKAGDLWSGRMTNRRKDGSLFEVEATIIPVHRFNGKVTDYLSVERDISRELLREKQMQQAQKMEAIGTLAAGIAHDFNNILAAIVGYTDITLHGIPKDSPHRAHLKKVLKAGDRAKSLVNQILAFSRSDEKETRPVVLQIILKEVMKLLKATLPSTISIQANLNSDAAIMANPTQIHQVIMNLCTNASYAMRENGGALSVILEPYTLDNAHPIGNETLEAGEYVRLVVEDTGEGIPPDSVERIFDPFYTTKKPGEGTGMGLAVVHGIVTECGGTIQVHSESGRGSSFEILLPVIDGETDSDVADDRPVPVGHERILFVDDESFIVDIGVQILKTLGYKVTGVTDSKEALAYFTRSPENFDLVITDMTMPHMTGDLLGQKMLALRPDIPIIITTGYSEKLNEASIRSLGFSGIAYKPLIIKELATIVRQTLDQGE
ncbi:MAG: PAS domain S-box protein [Desulfobacteraceae bacterium]